MKNLKFGTAVDHIDHLDGIHSLSLVNTLKVYMIKTVLSIKHIHHTLNDRLYYYHASIEVCLLVGVPDYPIYKCSKEVTLTELNHFSRILVNLCGLSVKLLHINTIFLLKY